MTEIETLATPPTSTPWVPVWGGQGLAYKGDWVAGTYVDGDVVVKDGMVFMCLGGPTAVAPDAAPWGATIIPGGQTEQLRGLATTDQALTTTKTPIPGTTLTLSKGAWLIVGDFDPFGSTTGWSLFVGTIDGTASIADYAAAIMSDFGFGGQRISMSKCWIVNAPSGGEQVWLAAYKTVAGGSILTYKNHTAITAIKLAWQGTMPQPSAVVSYGTTLPASPVDGQEAILVDNATNPGYQWRFRYNAGSSSPYKWEFVGGPPAMHFISTGEATTTPSVYVNLATIGPRLTLPRTGEYQIRASAQYFHSVTGITCYAALGVGDFSSVVAQRSTTSAGVGWSFIVDVEAPFELGAGSEVRFKYYMSGAGTMTIYDRVLLVTPRRVA